MAPKTPHVVVLLLNWNGWSDTIACLESLKQSDYANASVLVVDNASTDESRVQLEKWAASESAACFGQRRFVDADAVSEVEALRAGDLVFIQSPINGGFAAGNNIGIRLALRLDADYIWVLNNDTEVAPTALSALVRKAESDRRIGMCGSLLVYHDDRGFIQACGGAHFNYWRALANQAGHGLHPGEPDLERVLTEPLSYIAGASLLARADMVRDVGPFTERYFLYFEEIDWAERARGWKLATALDSVVFHKEGRAIGTSGRAERSPMSQYYLHRNMILFYWRFHKLKLWVAIGRVCKELMYRIRVKDQRLTGVTWRALAHGLFQVEGPIDPALLKRAAK